MFHRWQNKLFKKEANRILIILLSFNIYLSKEFESAIQQVDKHFIKQYFILFDNYWQYIVLFTTNVRC